MGILPGQHETGATHYSIAIFPDINEAHARIGARVGTAKQGRFWCDQHKVFGAALFNDVGCNHDTVGMLLKRTFQHIVALTITGKDKIQRHHFCSCAG